MKRGIDYSVMFITLVLVLIGLVLVYEASYYTASQYKIYNYDGNYFLKKQLLGAVVGTIAMIVLANFNYKFIERFKWIVLGLTIGLLVLVMTPVGVSANGATRWLNVFGMSVQPSEIAKFAIILYTASVMAANRDRVQSFKYGIIPILMVSGVMIILVAVQPNMSMAICMTLLVGVMLYVGGARAKHMLILVTLAITAIAILFIVDNATGSYRLARYTAFIDPFSDLKDTGWQLSQSLMGLGSGGIFGTGFGLGKQKYLWLPYSESDFILSILGEEFGLLGCLVLLILFALLIWRGVRIAHKCQDLFGCLLASGIISIIALQVLINGFVVTSSIPPTGVPLPFISAGNTQLVLFMAQIGILLNISRNSQTA